MWASIKARFKKNEHQSNDDRRDETADDRVASENELDELPALSPMLFGQRERKISRRLGIAERNHTERMVVQKTVENFVLIKNINDITHS